MDHSRNQGERQDGSPSDATFFRMEVVSVERTHRDRAGLTEGREYEVTLRGTDGARFIFTTPTPPTIDALFDLELMDTSEGGNRAIRRASVLAGTHLDTCNAEVERIVGDILLHAVIVFCGDQTYGEPSKATDSLKDFLASYAPEYESWYDPRKSVAIVGPLVNGQLTVILAPSGSKLGWAADKEWRTFREKFIEWAKTRRYAHILRVTDIYEPDGNQERWRVEEDRGAVGVGSET